MILHPGDMLGLLKHDIHTGNLHHFKDFIGDKIIPVGIGDCVEAMLVEPFEES